MSQPPTSYLTALREGIIATFDAEELPTLCFDLEIDYENLRGSGKAAKALALVEYAIRHDKLAPLAAYCARKRPRYDWPYDPVIAPQMPQTANATVQPAAAPPPVSHATSRHLHQQLTELQGRYETLSKRIAALDKDLGRTLDSETKLVLEERRQELVAERDRAAADMARIERQLAGVGAVVPPPAAQDAPPAVLSFEERASLMRQLAELRESLRLIEERKSEYVQETNVPLQLIKDERRVRERIAALMDALGVAR